MKRNATLLFLIFSWTLSHGQSKQLPDVQPFNQISFSIPGKAYVRQGNAYTVELDGPADVLDEIEAVVEGDKLSLRSKDKRFRWDGRDVKNITVRITTKNINALHVSGSGEMLVMTRVKANNLNLKVSGSGSLKVEADAGDVTAHVSGSGDITLRGNLKNVKSSVSGSGKINLQADVAGLATFDISGSGDALAQGSANEVEAQISGSGKVLAAGLATKSCKVRISGSGSVEINVSDELDATISGSGDVRYTGNPSRLNVHSSGSGKIRKLNS
ncbi:MAG: DUF2807 domain-containing protein [Cyclobacteriaceae bacterium]|nr:DUF2807 domain-containing protein [Cyclobacteriaceae bacterium]MCX7638662.1 DUF2807 domain-containing protein [Cyclobacteriaceae bacterium]MDW8332213.1 DUF2807 domain-containing protein [Cyclobacteriaceae bacterium]